MNLKNLSVRLLVLILLAILDQVIILNININKKGEDYLSGGLKTFITLSSNLLLLKQWIIINLFIVNIF